MRIVKNYILPCLNVLVGFCIIEFVFREMDMWCNLNKDEICEIILNPES